MQQSVSDPRIGKMFSGDRLWSVVAIVVLWATYSFVCWKVMPYIDTNEELVALSAGAALVLLFNSAAILAMLSHYAEDKEHIYGLDIHYLDEMTKAKG